MAEIRFTENPLGHTDGDAIELRPPEWHALSNAQRKGRLHILEHELERQADAKGFESVTGSVRSDVHYLHRAMAEPAAGGQRSPEAVWLKVSARFVQTSKPGKAFHGPAVHVTAMEDYLPAEARAAYERTANQQLDDEVVSRQLTEIPGHRSFRWGRPTDQDGTEPRTPPAGDDALWLHAVCRVE